MPALFQDLKFGFRMLLRKPLLSAGISLSLALGIGANSAIFSLVDAVLFRPLPVGNSSRLVSLYTSDYSGAQYGSSSYADFVDFWSMRESFEDLAAFTEISTNLKVDNRAEREFGLLVSENYFDLLDVKTARGRTFRAGEDPTSPAFVVSHDLWQRRFGGDPALVGKTVFLNSVGCTVIGITPEGFNGIDLGRTPEFFVPVNTSTQIGFEPGFTTNRGTRNFSIIGRLNPNVSVGQAQANLNNLARQLADYYPDWKERNEHPRKISLIAESYARVRPEVRSVLTGLAGLFTFLVVLVLLIACINVSHILLARATARQKEISVRRALGASRSRIVRQLLTESLQLSLIGSILGILLAPVFIKLLVTAFLPTSTARLPLDITTNQHVVLFTVGVGLLTAVIFGLVPALHASRSDVLLAMKDDSGTWQTGWRRLGIGNLFAISQISASLLLLIVAGLFIRSLRDARDQDLGYDVDKVVTVRLNAEFLEERNTGRQLIFYSKLLEQVRSLHGVTGASFADFIPSGGGLRRATIDVQDYAPRAGENMDVMNGVVAAHYFRTMGIDVIAGREFTDQDKEGTPRTAIINKSMAQRYWPGQDPLGKHITIVGSRTGQLEVVGIVKDTTSYISQESSTTFLYLPMLQNPSPGMTLHVRSETDPMATLPAVRNVVDSLEENVTLGEVKTLSDFVSDSLLMLRVVSSLTGLFGLLASALALVGVFSVINYSTSRRTREIGIRLALGAQRVDILNMILKEGLLIIVAGIVGGLLLAFLATRLIDSFQVSRSGNGLPVYALISLTLIVVALLACLIPAYKATKVDPNDALRHE